MFVLHFSAAKFSRLFRPHRSPDIFPRYIPVSYHIYIYIVILPLCFIFTDRISCREASLGTRRTLTLSRSLAGSGRCWSRRQVTAPREYSTYQIDESRACARAARASCSICSGYPIRDAPRPRDRPCDSSARFSEKAAPPGTSLEIFVLPV